MPLSEGEQQRLARLEEQVRTLDRERNNLLGRDLAREADVEKLHRHLRDLVVGGVVLAGVLGVTTFYQVPGAIEDAVVRAVEADDGALIAEPLNEAVSHFMTQTEGANLLDRIRDDSGKARLLLSDADAIYQEAADRLGDVPSASELRVSFSNLGNRIGELESLPVRIDTLETWRTEAEPASTTLQQELTRLSESASGADSSLREELTNLSQSSASRDDLSNLLATAGRVKVITVEIESVSNDPAKDCDGGESPRFHYRVSLAGQPVAIRERSQAASPGNDGRIEIRSTSSVLVSEDEFALEFVAFDRDGAGAGDDEILGPRRVDYSIENGWDDGWRNLPVAEAGSTTCEVTFRYRLRDALSLVPQS